MHEREVKFYYLHVTFGDIERCDTSMSNTAGKDTTKHTLGIVRDIVRDRADVSG